jgi:succinate-semialdehyde dehydrogenase/glutarate-semialdehyde dehydrogenase
MMSETDQVLAIPLWINGRAYLTIAPAFFDVRDAASGEIKRRTPLCGASEALAAATSAQAALPDWAARTVAERAALLLALADALAEYGEHFAALISEESGKDAALAAAEVGDALSLLRGASPGAASDTGNSGSAVRAVVAIVSDDSAPLLGPLRHAVPALLAGATVIVKPSPKAPSAAFALAELSARSAFPGGVLNILHGDLAAIEGLCVLSEVSRLYFAGDPALGAKVAELACRYDKPCVD